MREWWTRDFTMDENWVLTSTATPRTYEGNHIYRYSFDVADLAKYSHMVIRVKYRYGIALWINSQRLLRERLQEWGCITSLTIREDEDAVYMWTMATSSASTYEWEE